MSKRYHGDKDLQEIQKGWDKIDKEEVKAEKALITFEWEQLTPETQRAKVIGGWLVSRYTQDVDGVSEAIVFVPDPNHEWRVK